MAASYIQANTSGRLHSAHEPSLTPLDRGFLYGDAIYEVWRTYEGVIFAWDEHFDRLERSAHALHLSLPWSRQDMRREIGRTVTAFRQATSFQGDVYIRLQVSRGAGSIGLDINLADRPEFVLLVQPCPRNSPEILRDGMKLSIAREIRRNPVESLSPAWKTGNYLNNILGLREARSRGADDVLLLNVRGEITEAATSNIAFVQDQAVVTPPLDVGILGGITRGLILGEIARLAGVQVREARLYQTDLAGMNECFLLSTSRDVTPVRAIDDFLFSVGPGTVTAKLKTAFENYMRAFALDHPDLKV